MKYGVLREDQSHQMMLGDSSCLFVIPFIRPQSSTLSCQEENTQADMAALKSKQRSCA